MNCAYCPIQDLCLEYYTKVLILHDYIDERNCPYKKIVEENYYEISQETNNY